MSNPWFRMYCDFLDDAKLISLAFEDQRHFIGILALKCSDVLDQDVSNPKLLDRIVAQKLWIDYAIIGDVKARLIAAGLIDDNWQPLAWDKLQRRSDHDTSGAERQRRYRENNRNALRDALCDGAVTPPDKNRIDTDKETDKNKTFAPPVGDALLSAWKQVRKAKRAGPITEIAWAGLVREARAAGIDPEEAVRECVERGWVSLKAEWIKKEDASQAKSSNHQWWATEKGIEAKGRELGLFPRGGESWHEFKGRINAKLGEVQHG